MKYYQDSDKEGNQLEKEQSRPTTNHKEKRVQEVLKS